MEEFDIVLNKMLRDGIEYTVYLDEDRVKMISFSHGRKHIKMAVRELDRMKLVHIRYFLLNF